MAKQSQAWPGHLKRILKTGTPHGEKRRLIPGELYPGYVPMNGGFGQSFPASSSFSGFGTVDPIQGAINLFQSSIWIKLLTIGGTIALLYYASQKEK